MHSRFNIKLRVLLCLVTIIAMSFCHRAVNASDPVAESDCLVSSAFKVVTSLQYTARGPWDNPEVIERGRTEKEVPVPEEGLPEPGAAPVAEEPAPITPKPETGS